MNICLDSYKILNHPGTFAASYSSQIIEELSKPDYPFVVHSIIEGSREGLPFKASPWCITPEIICDRERRIYDAIERYILEEDIKVFHSLDNGFSLPEKVLCKYLSTIHSLYPLTHKEMVDKDTYENYYTLLPKVIERSHKLIAVSSFIKNELINHFNVPSDKIEVIYPLISKAMNPMPIKQCKSYIASKYGIRGSFIYYSGNIDRSKHISELLIIFKLVYSRCPKTWLILSGSLDENNSEYYKELLALASKLSINERIIFTGAIPYNDMPYFYNAASCVISLSEYDGYPLGLVEAAACGTPVICLNTEVNMEILKDTAVTCNLEKIKDIAELIAYIVNSRELRSLITSKMKPAKTGLPLDYINLYDKIIKS